ncbi:MAG TPA: alpha/beta fold hydrolase, partial [Devosia sp.]|nr:alpha/beta fold hydrolase [Devosia sp.]
MATRGLLAFAGCEGNTLILTTTPNKRVVWFGVGPGTEKRGRNMSTFLLIHGGWHGGWCWDKVKPLLEAEGHTVMAPDLPGHGDDTTPISEVSMDLYARATVEFAAQALEPVIVVGHSMTGLSNSQAVEYAPEKFKAQVFMAAFLLSNGQCLLDQARPDTENLVLRNLTFSEDQSQMTF